METKLKSCPFCGQKDDGSTDSGLFVIQDKNGARFVYCEVCEAKGPRIKCDDVMEAIEKAKAAWNMRAGDGHMYRARCALFDQITRRKK